MSKVFDDHVTAIGNSKSAVRTSCRLSVQLEYGVATVPSIRDPAAMNLGSAGGVMLDQVILLPAPKAYGKPDEVVSISVHPPTEIEPRRRAASKPTPEAFSIENRT